jgi:hypothetical protein
MAEYSTVTGGRSPSPGRDHATGSLQVFSPGLLAKVLQVVRASAVRASGSARARAIGVMACVTYVHAIFDRPDKPFVHVPVSQLPLTVVSLNETVPRPSHRTAPWPAGGWLTWTEPRFKPLLLGAQINAIRKISAPSVHLVVARTEPPGSPLLTATRFGAYPC